MSGAPILQDGRLIGAVTHVFVQDSSKGYGIYIEDMRKESDGFKHKKIPRVRCFGPDRYLDIQYLTSKRIDLFV